MTNVAVREPQTLTVLSNEQLKFIAGTEFVPKGLRGNLPAILACVATGRALGIDDMTAIRNIHVIDGRPAFAAELMVMLVRRAGHSITGEVTAEGAKVTGTRADNGDTMTATFTMEMAKRAGLANKANWRSYPESMCWARAVSQLCRMLFPDCFAGGTYTAEELGDDSAGEPTAGVGIPVTQAESAESLAHEPASPAEEWDGTFPPPDDVELPEVEVIPEPKRKLLRKLQKDSGVSDERLKQLVFEITGVESSKLIPVARFDALCAAVKAEPPGELDFAARAAEAIAKRSEL